jgi:predicted SAM-dependent methyltransferase
VLEHIPNDYDAIGEIHRILKPGGWAILQVPVSRVLETTYEDPSITEPDRREEAFGQFDHVRIYGQDYRTRLEKAGFMVKTYNPTKEKWKTNLNQYAINPLEDLYVAYK